MDIASCIWQQGTGSSQVELVPLSASELDEEIAALLSDHQNPSHLYLSTPTARIASPFSQDSGFHQYNQHHYMYENYATAPYGSYQSAVTYCHPAPYYQQPYPMTSHRIPGGFINYHNALRHINRRSFSGSGGINLVQKFIDEELKPLEKAKRPMSCENKENETMPSSFPSSDNNSQQATFPDTQDITPAGKVERLHPKDRPLKNRRGDATDPSRKKRSFTCDVCQSQLSSPESLKTHKLSHTLERPLVCRHCPKTFRQRSSLRVHERIHTGSKPYACRECGQDFRDYSTYVKHQRTHTGEKPYECDVCRKCFTQSGNLIRHKKTHLKSGH